jgi:hypothetical protein
MPVRFFTLLLAFPLFIACEEKPKTQAALVNKDAVAADSLPEKRENGVLFSIEDLDSAAWISPTEYPLKKIGHDGELYDNKDYLLKLPNYKNFEIVILSASGKNNEPYIFGVVKSGILHVDTNLTITPQWDNSYRKKTFKIYNDYTVQIDTENKENNYSPEYTEYYRINDNGDFYGDIHSEGEDSEKRNFVVKSDWEGVKCKKYYTGYGAPFQKCVFPNANLQQVYNIVKRVDENLKTELPVESFKYSPSEKTGCMEVDYKYKSEKHLIVEVHYGGGTTILEIIEDKNNTHSTITYDGG